jgi:hypothetical protein
MLPRIEKDRSNIPISTSLLHDKEYNNMQYILHIKNIDTCNNMNPCNRMNTYNSIKMDRRRTSSEKRVFGTKVY